MRRNLPESPSTGCSRFPEEFTGHRPGKFLYAGLTGNPDSEDAELIRFLSHEG